MTVVEAVASSRDRIINATAVLNGEYPDPRYLVDGVLPDAGLVVLTGSKAVGKTFALLSMAAGMAAGGRALGRLECDRARVLFLELELSERILNRRMKRMLFSDVDGLELAFGWRQGTEGIRDLHEAIDAENYEVVFIDVLQRFWPPNLDPNSYQDSYELLGKLRELANYHDVCIVVATHSGKTERTDVMHSTIGSVGIQANSDVQLFLARVRGSESAVLQVHGNDLESHDLAMRFDADMLTWIVTDEDPREVSQSPERREILDLLHDQGPLRSGEVAEITGRAPAATNNLLRKLLAEGLLCQPGYGLYMVAGGQSSSVSDVSSVSADEDTPLQPLTPVHSAGGNGNGEGDELDIF